MTGQYVIGLDVGTTSVKACLFTLHGKLLADAEEMNAFYYPQPGWAEQDAEEIEQSAVRAVREVLNKGKVMKDELVSIGISAAMHSLLCVRKDGKPLSRALIWSDARSAGQAERAAKNAGSSIYARTGTPIHPMTPFSKLLWMKETGFLPYEQADFFMSIKEYLIFRWFNKRVIDYSMASATGLFNPVSLKWETDLLQMAGIREDQLSKVVPPVYQLTGMNQETAEEMGIDQDMPIAIGAADGQLANLGIGAVLPGEAAVSVGTSGAIRQMTKGVKMADNQETFCYAFTETISVIGGPTNNGGIVLQWLKEILQDEGSFEEFLQAAASVPPGSEGMVFIPYINGERAPIWNPRAKGNFYGVTITHKREHFIRAVLEGITFNLYQIGKTLEYLAGEPKRIYVNGGLARSSLWLQMMADIFHTEIHVSKSHHSAAWGAAWTALTADGRAAFEDIKANIPLGEPFQPNEVNSALYQEQFAKYEALAKDIAGHFS